MMQQRQQQKYQKQKWYQVHKQEKEQQKQQPKKAIAIDNRENIPETELERDEQSSVEELNESNHWPPKIDEHNAVNFTDVFYIGEVKSIKDEETVMVHIFFFV